MAAILTTFALTIGTVMREPHNLCRLNSFLLTLEYRLNLIYTRRYFLVRLTQCSFYLKGLLITIRPHGLSLLWGDCSISPDTLLPLFFPADACFQSLSPRGWPRIFTTEGGVPYPTLGWDFNHMPNVSTRFYLM